MTGLSWEILSFLLLAFLLGLVLGWWLGRYRRRRQTGRLEEKWRLKHEYARRRLEDCREELEACRQQLGPRSELAESEEEPAERPEAMKAVEAPAAKQAEAESATPESDTIEADTTTADTTTAALVGAMPAGKADLKKIEGIGPKIEGLLNAGGIVTWAQLAAAETERLQSILDAAGPRYRIHDPSTWPQQAELAAAGARDKLEELQGRLKGGRRT